MGRSDRHGIDVLAGQQVAEVPVDLAVVVAVMLVDSCPGGFGVDSHHVAQGDHLRLGQSQKPVHILVRPHATADASHHNPLAGRGLPLGPQSGGSDYTGRAQGEPAGASGWGKDLVGCSVKAVIKPPKGRLNDSGIEKDQNSFRRRREVLSPFSPTRGPTVPRSPGSPPSLCPLYIVLGLPDFARLQESRGGNAVRNLHRRASTARFTWLRAIRPVEGRGGSG